MMAAFSRSKSPMRPISLDSVMSAPGAASARISPALRSSSLLIGLKTELIAIERISFARCPWRSCEARPRRPA